jgi:hypothetical protein
VIKYLSGACNVNVAPHSSENNVTYKRPEKLTAQLSTEAAGLEDAAGGAWAGDPFIQLPVVYSTRFT